MIEILVAATILSLFVIGILAVLNSSDTTWNIDMGLVQLQQQTRGAMARTVREIRQADSVISASGTTITFSTPWATSGNIVYSLVSGQIIRTYNSSTSVLGNNINSLSFSHSSGVVEIQIQAQKSVRGRTITFPMTGNLVEKVRLRN
ncbi:MAG: hypothetical protein HQ570_01195 [Candidatus Omnitrophica bacterium]|nr:hypothetical protein [Candidatus Omnitrophota bacterium]